MGLFRDTIRDARRRLPATGTVVQRMHDASAPSAEPTSPAPPIEEQPDGALTLYRFQKEGRLVPREVPKRVEPVPVDRRRGDPSLDVGRSSLGSERVTNSIDNAIMVDDGSVIASSRKNGLATGKGDIAHKVRQDSSVNEASSIGLYGFQQQVSDDLNSVESPPGQHDPVDTYSSDNLQRETGECELSRDAGLGTPSETFSSRPSGEAAKSPVVPDNDQILSPKNMVVNGPPLVEPIPKWEGGQEPVRNESSSDGFLVENEPKGPYPLPSVEPTKIRVDGQEAFVTPQPEAGNRAEMAQQAEPKVSIGQIDVVVVSSAPAPKVPAPAARSNGMASRRYWRRL